MMKNLFLSMLLYKRLLKTQISIIIILILDMDISVEEIILIVGLQLGIKYISEEQRIVEDLGAQSADLVNIIVAIEEKYKIFISEEKIAKIRTVKDLYSSVEDQLNNRG